jgi:hypothetical protein
VELVRLLCGQISTLGAHCTPHDRTAVDSSHDGPDVEPRVVHAGLSRESALLSKRLALSLFPSRANDRRNRILIAEKFSGQRWRWKAEIRRAQ